MDEQWLLDQLLEALVQGQAALDEAITRERYRFGLKASLPQTSNHLGALERRGPDLIKSHLPTFRSGCGPEARQPLAEVRASLGVESAEFVQALADILGWTPTGDLLAKWERGEQAPPGQVLAAASHLSPAGLRLLLVREASAKLTGMQRRTFLIGIAGLVATTDWEPWERLALAPQRPSRIDQQVLDHLEGVTVALERLESQAEPGALFEAVSSHLEQLTSLLGSSLSPAVRRHLSSMAGEAAGVAGRLQWILDDDGGAQAYYQVGLEAAAEAGDAALGAYLMGKAACKPFYREDPHTRLARLSGSFGFRPRDATPTTRAWLAMLEAEAHALKNDNESCSRALDRAAAQMAQQRTDEIPRPRVTFFDHIWFTGQRGACFAKLGQYDEARDALRTALNGLDSPWTKQRTWLLAVLAGTYVEDAPEEACRLGTEALASAVAVKARADYGLVRGLRQDLRIWDSRPAVQQFDEDIRASIGQN